jgi:hypothetical protein
MIRSHRARFRRAQPMNSIATKSQLPGKPVTGVSLTARTEGASHRFDFAQARRERLLGPAHYLILLRRQHAGRADLSWEFRSITN